MAPVNDTTTNRLYQKPNSLNTLAYDVVRIRAALDSIDSDIQSLLAGSVGYSIGSDPPTLPTTGSLWTDKDNGLTFVYANDGDSLQWIEVGGGTYGPQGPRGPSGPKTVQILYPTATEKVPLFYTETAITVYQLSAVIEAQAVYIGGVLTSPTISYRIYYGTDYSLTGTSLTASDILLDSTNATNGTTSGLHTTSIANAAIPAGRWVWLTTTAKTAVVSSLNVVMFFA